MRAAASRRASNMYRLLTWGAPTLRAAVTLSPPCLAAFPHHAAKLPRFPSLPPLPGRTNALTLDACRACDTAASYSVASLLARLPPSLPSSRASLFAALSLSPGFALPVVTLAPPRFPSPLWARYARPRHASPRAADYVPTSCSMVFPLAAGANLAECACRPSIRLRHDECLRHIE